MMKKIAVWERDHQGTAMLLRKFKRAVDEIASGSNVILYGSRARGDENSESDYDVLVILPDCYDTSIVEQVRNCLYNIEIEESIIISVMIKKQSEWESKRYDLLPLKKNILKEGVAV